MARIGGGIVHVQDGRGLPGAVDVGFKEIA